MPEAFLGLCSIPGGPGTGRCLHDPCHPLAFLLAASLSQPRSWLQVASKCTAGRNLSFTSGGAQKCWRKRAGGERELLLPPLGPCNKLNGSSKEGSECHISARATQGQVSICTKRKGMQKSLILMQLCREKPPSPQPQRGGGGCAWQPGHLL